ncbi:MAG: hypothetical protein EOP09_20200, partial [Proteobacteria bacterium]
MKRQTIAQSPSNIAFIKYMGKIDSSRNAPANSSISLTLDSLSSYVSLTDAEQLSGQGESRFIWKGEKPATVPGDSPHLSASGIEKFTKFCGKLSSQAPSLLKSFGIEPRDLPAAIEIRTSNT